MTEDIQNLRQNYNLEKLELSDLSPNPFQQFETWFNFALSQNVKEPNAMTLATATRDGIPSARVVLLKGFDENGFIFYTNYNSHKAKELMENPNAALVFCWLGLHKQIRIQGSVKKLSAAKSTQYFQSRPKGSQIGAWVSPQSSTIENRDVLEENVKKLEEKYAKLDILPKPEHWGGFLVKPTLIEFWQGRTSRLHDRFCYSFMENGEWKIERLAP